MAVRRGKPKPFSRPSFDLDHHTKSWREALPSQLEVGDMVRDLGMIEAISSAAETFCILFVSGKTVYLTDDTQVVAFTEAH